MANKGKAVDKKITTQAPFTPKLLTLSHSLHEQMLFSHLSQNRNLFDLLPVLDLKVKKKSRNHQNKLWKDLSQLSDLKEMLIHFSSSHSLSPNLSHQKN